MIYPKSIQIGGHVYQIILENIPSIDSESNVGEHHYGKSTLRVATRNIDSTQRSEQAIMETICHEMCHAVNYIFCHSELTEKQVASFSQGVYQVLSQLQLTADVKCKLVPIV
uniref:SprT-like domain-containing protein n=1 Tax=viral metagenome TaxID=1070528 RepID=A0A6M3JHF4_9ZZZZ